MLEAALQNMTTYYKENSLRPNPTKTHTAAFHLRNREANKQLQVRWNDVLLEHSEAPKYLGVVLDSTLSYRRHVEKTKAKVNTRNNIIDKLTNSSFGSDPTTIRTAALALCFSAAEYASPVWSRSTHARKVDTALNTACRKITGCLKPTKVEHLYELAGIEAPSERRGWAATNERFKVDTDPRHPLHNH